MTQSNISIRIDNQLKQQFDSLCNELGLSMSSALNLFVKTVVREQRIPFEIALYKLNKETIKAIEDAENGIGLSKRFDNARDAINAMLED